MSSRRKLKKSINSVMDLLYTDCIFYKVFVVDADQEAADKIIAKITEVQSDLLKRVSVSEGKEVKGRVKAYFKKLNADLRDQTNAIAKEIAALG
ncbi:MAG: hypothetical protein E6767_07245 [Dysgonomonas sp.]|nr:hypothetical protein [Dysgonomonas sp.]